MKTTIENPSLQVLKDTCLREDLYWAEVNFKRDEWLTYQFRIFYQPDYNEKQGLDEIYMTVFWVHDYGRLVQDSRCFSKRNLSDTLNNYWLYYPCTLTFCERE